MSRNHLVSLYFLIKNANFFDCYHEQCTLNHFFAPVNDSKYNHQQISLRGPWPMPGARD